MHTVAFCKSEQRFQCELHSDCWFSMAYLSLKEFCGSTDWRMPCLLGTEDWVAFDCPGKHTVNASQSTIEANKMKPMCTPVNLQTWESFGRSCSHILPFHGPPEFHRKALRLLLPLESSETIASKLCCG